MDYSRYAAESYVRLVRVFDPIAQILTMQLHLLDYMGFDMNNGYLFGFSYGGQLATEAGRRIGHRRLKEIDSKSIEIAFLCEYFAFLFYLNSMCVRVARANVFFIVLLLLSVSLL